MIPLYEIRKEMNHWQNQLKEAIEAGEPFSDWKEIIEEIIYLKKLEEEEERRIYQ